MNEIERLRAELILLDKVLNHARMVLLTSLNNEGQPSQTSLAALSESCRAHWEWKAKQITPSKEIIDWKKTPVVRKDTSQ